MPFGGKYQKTPVEGMVAKIPVPGSKTTTASIFTHGYDPDLAVWSPFHGALYAVLQSVAKLVALGGDRRQAYLTMQEFFQSLGTNEKAWGQPVSALLGAYVAQKELQIAAIGGKDSMSGTFENLTVPPTLVSFAIVPEKTNHIISPEFKQAGDMVLLFDLPRDAEDMPAGLLRRWYKWHLAIALALPLMTSSLYRNSSISGMELFLLKLMKRLHASGKKKITCAVLA